MPRHVVAAVLVAVWATAPLGATDASAPASAVVENLHESLLASMKAAHALGFEGRRERLAPVIAQVFDIPLIARSATGRYWASFVPAQRQKLVDALRRLTVATYAARFDDYSGERFRVVSERAAPRGTVLVNTELVKADGEAVSIDYLVRPTDEGWRIVDVYLKGVYSELAVRRSEYTAVIKRAGLDGLLATIEDKIASYASGG